MKITKIKAGDLESCICWEPRKEDRSTCRCTYSKCASRDLAWVSWGSYLDKDLKCQDCGYVQDYWDC